MTCINLDLVWNIPKLLVTWLLSINGNAIWPILCGIMFEYWLWASKENKNDKTLDLQSFRFCLNLIRIQVLLNRSFECAITHYDVIVVVVIKTNQKIVALCDCLDYHISIVALCDYLDNITYPFWDHNGCLQWHHFLLVIHYVIA